MFIFYLAIVLLVLGVIILINSIEVRSTKVVNIPPKRRKFNNKPQIKIDQETMKEPVHYTESLETGQHMLDEKDVPVQNKGFADIEDVNKIQPEVEPQGEYNYKTSYSDNISQFQNDAGINNNSYAYQTDAAQSTQEENRDEFHNSAIAVLFEDKANVLKFDYSEVDAVTVNNKFKNLKRVGEGSLKLTGDSIIFHAQKKMYKFNFKKIENFEARDNVIIFKQSGSNSSVVLILESNYEFVSEIINKITLQKKG